MEKEVYIIENNSELGAGTRGSSLGIEALKVAALNAESKFFKENPTHLIQTYNELLLEENVTPSAIRIDGIKKVYQNISNEVKSVLKENKFPLILASDHSSAGGTIAGIRASFPDKKMGVVWIDAHGDLHSPYTSPTGNIHGMPLATALNEDNLPNQVKEVGEKSKQAWEDLKNLEGITPKILPEDLVFFGVRDTEQPEDELRKRLNIKNFTVEECRKTGIQSSVKEALDLLSNCDNIYISFDVDSMDCDLVSYGTGTPVPNGFTPKEAEDIIKEFLKSKKIVCFEMVEINPTLDNKQNKMADTAFEILENIYPSFKKQTV